MRTAVYLMTVVVASLCVSCQKEPTTTPRSDDVRIQETAEQVLGKRKHFPLSVPCGDGTIRTAKHAVNAFWDRPGRPSEVVHNDDSRVLQNVVKCGGGVVSSLSNWKSEHWASYSATCSPLDGAPAERVWDGRRKYSMSIIEPHPSSPGVRVMIVPSSSPASGPDPKDYLYFHSPDCHNLGGGGNTVSIPRWF